VSTGAKEKSEATPNQQMTTDLGGAHAEFYELRENENKVAYQQVRQANPNRSGFKRIYGTRAWWSEGRGGVLLL
jgi:hypothetical protein